MGRVREKKKWWQLANSVVLFRIPHIIDFENITVYKSHHLEHLIRMVAARCGFIYTIYSTIHSMGGVCTGLQKGHSQH